MKSDIFAFIHLLENNTFVRQFPTVALSQINALEATIEIKYFACIFATLNMQVKLPRGGCYQWCPKSFFENRFGKKLKTLGLETSLRKTETIYCKPSIVSFPTEQQLNRIHCGNETSNNLKLFHYGNWPFSPVTALQTG